MHRSSSRVDRQYGVNIWGRPNSPIERRKYRLGQHGKVQKKKVSNYCIQLVSKQKIRVYYNLAERQLKNLFKLSSKDRRLDPGMSLIANLERRLDQVVYKLKFAPTIFSARQLVTHKHFMVNGSVVNIPSYLLNPGDVVSVRESSKNMAIIRGTHEQGSVVLPSYLRMDGDLKGSFVKIPEDLKEIPFPFEADPSAIVEKYAKLV
jgi:small subunit ribosomal protein S4